jgi:hypothetical protein
MTGDPLFDSIPWTIWTAVECNIAIIAASVPSVIPLFKKFHALKKGTNKSSQKRNRTETQDIEQGDQKYSGTKTSTFRKSSMQQGLLVDSDRDVTKRDMTPKIKIEDEESSSPDSDDDEDISQMYANASRSISKRPTLQASAQEDRTSTSNSALVIGEKMWDDGRQ